MKKTLLLLLIGLSSLCGVGATDPNAILGTSAPKQLILHFVRSVEPRS